jgi:hypothetical protein
MCAGAVSISDKYINNQKGKLTEDNSLLAKVLSEIHTFDSGDNGGEVKENRNDIPVNPQSKEKDIIRSSADYNYLPRGATALAAALESLRQIAKTAR